MAPARAPAVGEWMWHLSRHEKPIPLCPQPSQDALERPVSAPAKSPAQVPAQRSEGGAGLREGWALSVGMWIGAGQTSESSSPPSRERLAGQRQLWPARAGRGRGRRSRGGVAGGGQGAMQMMIGRAGGGESRGAGKRAPEPRPSGKLARSRDAPALGGGRPPAAGGSRVPT